MSHHIDVRILCAQCGARPSERNGKEEMDRKRQTASMQKRNISSRLCGPNRISALDVSLLKIGKTWITVRYYI